MKDVNETNLNTLPISQESNPLRKTIKEIVKNYTVTVGSFAFKQNAIDFQQELLNRFGEKAFIQEDAYHGLFRLNIGRYQHLSDGQQLVRNFKKAGIDCYMRIL